MGGTSAVRLERSLMAKYNFRYALVRSIMAKARENLGVKSKFGPVSAECEAEIIRMCDACVQLGEESFLEKENITDEIPHEDNSAESPVAPSSSPVRKPTRSTSSLTVATVVSSSPIHSVPPPPTTAKASQSPYMARKKAAEQIPPATTPTKSPTKSPGTYRAKKMAAEEAKRKEEELKRQKEEEEKKQKLLAEENKRSEQEEKERMEIEKQKKMVEEQRKKKLEEFKKIEMEKRRKEVEDVRRMLEEKEKKGKEEEQKKKELEKKKEIEAEKRRKEVEKVRKRLEEKEKKEAEKKRKENLARIKKENEQTLARQKRLEAEEAAAAEEEESSSEEEEEEESESEEESSSGEYESSSEESSDHIPNRQFRPDVPRTPVQRSKSPRSILLQTGKFSDHYNLSSKIVSKGGAYYREGYNAAKDITLCVKVLGDKEVSEHSDEYDDYDDDNSRQSSGSCPKSYGNVQKEIEILTELRHPNILHVVEAYQEDSKFYLVVDNIMPGAIVDLFDRISLKFNFSEHDAREMIIGVLNGIAFCHNRRIAYRDIRDETLLIKSGEHDHLVLSSFVIAKKVTAPNSLITFCGSPIHIAPEILTLGKDVTGRGDGYDEAVDMWAIGVLCFIIIGGYAPFDAADPDEMCRQIREGDFEFHENFWSHISPSAKELVSSLLTVDSKKRITADQALNSSWITESKSVLEEKDLSGINGLEFREYNVKRKLREAMTPTITAKMRRNSQLFGVNRAIRAMSK